MIPADIYEHFRDLIPTFCPKKARREGDLLIATSTGLELSHLNETAAFFCLAADGATTVDGIVQRMLAEYDVDADTLRHDICHLIRDLQWKRLIRLRRGA